MLEPVKKELVSSGEKKQMKDWYVGRYQRKEVLGKKEPSNLQ